MSVSVCMQRVGQVAPPAESRALGVAAPRGPRLKELLPREPISRGLGGAVSKSLGLGAKCRAEVLGARQATGRRRRRRRESAPPQVALIVSAACSG